MRPCRGVRTERYKFIHFFHRAAGVRALRSRDRSGRDEQPLRQAGIRGDYRAPERRLAALRIETNDTLPIQAQRHSAALGLWNAVRIRFGEALEVINRAADPRRTKALWASSCRFQEIGLWPTLFSPQSREWFKAAGEVPFEAVHGRKAIGMRWPPARVSDPWILPRFRVGTRQLANERQLNSGRVRHSLQLNYPSSLTNPVVPIAVQAGCGSEMNSFLTVWKVLACAFASPENSGADQS